MRVIFRYQALKDLLARYCRTFRHFWKQRDLISLPTLQPHEAEFQPAALAIQAAPVSPVGRLVAKLLAVLVALLLLWSIFGKVDIVANGKGKIIPGGRTKAIASVEVAKVTGLHVDEGQHVKQGDVLIELDPRISESERQKADSDRQLSLLQIERSNVLLQAIESGKTPHLVPIDGVDMAYQAREAAHLQDQWQDFLAKKKRLLSQIKRYQQQVPLAAKKAQDYEVLARDHDVAEHAWMEKQQAYHELQGQLDDAQTQLQTLITETRRNAQDELYQATRIWSESKQDVQKAAAHTEQLKLTAPVDGTVQQLNVHTVGGVVTAAQALMLVVPEKSIVEFEAYVENKDIGFIQEGQHAQVKIDTFEYTKYGTIDAVVAHVSQDAIDPSSNGTVSNPGKDVPQDDKKASGGAVYSIKIALKKSSMNVDGKEVRLLPGMSGSVEILTGERRIIEYVLSPLMTHARESLHER